MKLTKNIDKCNHMPKLQGNGGKNNPWEPLLLKIQGQKSDFTRFSLEIGGKI